LKLGVHVGPVIAMTANDRLDYFGRTVNVAARLGDQSVGGDVVVMRDTVSVDRADVVVEPFECRLRGLEGEQRLVRLRVVEKARNIVGFSTSPLTRDRVRSSS
jgi:adenylate cyclase